MSLLQGKNAIVTGAGNGIAKAICLAFVTEGARVGVVDIDGAAAEQTVKEVEARGGEAIALQTDVSVRTEVDAAVAATVAAFGTIDILVNAAIAGAPRIPLLETTEELCDAMFRTGPLGTLFFIQACHPHLCGRDASIINFASGADMMGTVGYAAYAPAKAGVRALTKVAARELGRDRIRVNCIAPMARTRLLEAWEQEDPARAQRALDAIPLGRFGDPEDDIARSAVYLASHYACYVTGNTLLVDGGSCLL